MGQPAKNKRQVLNPLANCQGEGTSPSPTCQGYFPQHLRSYGRWAMIGLKDGNCYKVPDVLQKPFKPTDTVFFTVFL